MGCCGGPRKESLRGFGSSEFCLSNLCPSPQGRGRWRQSVWDDQACPNLLDLLQPGSFDAAWVRELELVLMKPGGSESSDTEQRQVSGPVLTHLEYGHPRVNGGEYRRHSFLLMAAQAREAESSWGNRPSVYPGWLAYRSDQRGLALYPRLVWVQTGAGCVVGPPVWFHRVEELGTLSGLVRKWLFGGGLQPICQAIDCLEGFEFAFIPTLLKRAGLGPRALPIFRRYQGQEHAGLWALLGALARTNAMELDPVRRFQGEISALQLIDYLRCYPQRVG
ncbi:MAG: hypothetical protein DWQ01_21310 [Planctomycetota bacterium]|nr:MAG: hypothetical protein DWQ01_21310 [Planctomycetota bacterium]